MTTRHLRKCLLVLSALFCGQTLFSQTGTVNTYAGNDAIFADAGQPATAAHLVQPSRLAVDSQGNVYIAASGLFMVLKVSTEGVISIFAGNGLSSGSSDGGPAVGSSLLNPTGLAFDSEGNLYIADSYTSNVRKVDTNGIITTVAGGSGAGGFAGDGGPATKALLANPNAIAVDRSGNLYILDFGNSRVRMVNTSGIISTIAGNGAFDYSGDGGPATQASFRYSAGIAVDSSGNVYVADTNNCRIRRISGGIVTTVAGTGVWGYNGDNIPATTAQLKGPQGVWVDSSGNIYIADSGNQRIRRVDASGKITTIAGSGTAGFGGDGGSAMEAMFSNPGAVALDASGAVLVADQDNNRIRRVVVGGTLSTFAGTTTSTGDGGASTQARLVNPTGVAVDSAGNLFIADSQANRVRKVTLAGTITTVAGNGQSGYSGNNGPAALAILNQPSAVAVDSSGNLLIADASNNMIRRVDATTGTITAIAGTGGCCYTGVGSGGDGGLATAAILYFPTQVTVDPTGNVYFTEIVQYGTAGSGVAIRRITTDGKVDTWAGGGTAGLGFSGDGGSPLAAQFGNSIEIAAGPDGSLYIADRANNRIRKVDPTGATITTVAGNGQNADTGDGGQATSAGLALLESVFVDTGGNIYIGCNSKVRKVSPGGVINTYAGNGRWSFSGDGGPATAASFAYLASMAMDSGGNLYLADENNKRIRQVQPSAAPMIGLSSTYLTLNASSTSQTFTLANSGKSTLNWTGAATTASGGEWLTLAPSTGAIVAGQNGTLVTVTANASGLASGDYYGQIQITSPNAASPVQSLTVRLTLQAAGEAPPQIVTNGVVNRASLQAPSAPGTLVSIIGSNFTDSPGYLVAPSLPWPNQLGGTSVTIGGVPVPLYEVSAGRIEAILPFELATNTTLPLVITRNNAISAPEAVGLVSSQPGIFTVSHDGKGAGDIGLLHADKSWVVLGGGETAKPGDVLEIYCTGLGATTPRAVAGFPAQVSPASPAIDTVTLTIGGVNVPVTFAGLSPGFSGLYQVNATVPAGIAPSQHAPIMVSQGGRTSNTVTIPIQ